MVDTWQLIDTERTRAAAAFDGLTAADWDAPSLCAGWRNRDALAHIVSTAEITQGRFFGGMLRNGFNFKKMVANDIRRVGADSPARLVERLRAAAPGRNHPPGRSPRC